MPRAGQRCGTLQFYLKLRTTAFGGPAARIAMMDEEVVRRRRWLREVGGWAGVAGVDIA
jgi:hypothetical protein